MVVAVYSGTFFHNTFFWSQNIPILDFSTPSFNSGLFNHELLNPKFMFEESGVEKSGVVMCPDSNRLQDISTPDFSTMNYNKGLGLNSSWLKSLGVRSPGLKLRVRTSCNHFLSHVHSR